MAEFGHIELTVCERLVHCNIFYYMLDLHGYGR